MSFNVANKRRHSLITFGLSAGAIFIFAMSAAAAGLGVFRNFRHEIRLNWITVY